MEQVGARISDCGLYRYSLWRIWRPQDELKPPTCVWICLNPSTANAAVDDPTVRKIRGFSKRLGYGGFVLLNIMAYRSTDPQGLLSVADPFGPENTPKHLKYQCVAASPDLPIVAWGAINKNFRPAVWKLLQELGSVRCLGYTANRDPRHPLMLPYTTQIEEYKP